MFHAHLFNKLVSLPFYHIIIMKIVHTVHK